MFGTRGRETGGIASALSTVLRCVRKGVGSACDSDADGL